MNQTVSLEYGKKSNYRFLLKEKTKNQPSPGGTLWKLFCNRKTMNLGLKVDQNKMYF